VVDPDGQRGEELEEVDICPAVGLVAQAYALALFEVDDDGKAVDQHVPGDGFQDLLRLDVDIRSGGTHDVLLDLVLMDPVPGSNGGPPPNPTHPIPPLS